MAAPVNLVDLIDGLVEPAEPSPVSLVPQTWGWAVVLLLLLGLAVWLGRRWVVRRHANAYRRVAARAVAEATTAADIAVVLRRAALAAYPRTDVAGLTGQDWLAFLESSGGLPIPPVTGAELLAAPYRPDRLPPSPELRLWAEAWVRGHAVAGARRQQTPSPRAMAA